MNETLGLSWWWYFVCVPMSVWLFRVLIQLRLDFFFSDEGEITLI